VINGWEIGTLWWRESGGLCMKMRGKILLESNNKMILFYHDGGLGGWMEFNISGIKKKGDKNE